MRCFKHQTKQIVFSIFTKLMNALRSEREIRSYNRRSLKFRISNIIARNRKITYSVKPKCQHFLSFLGFLEHRNKDASIRLSDADETSRR